VPLLETLSKLYIIPKYFEGQSEGHDNYQILLRDSTNDSFVGIPLPEKQYNNFSESQKPLELFSRPRVREDYFTDRSRAEHRRWREFRDHDRVEGFKVHAPFNVLWEDALSVVIPKVGKKEAIMSQLESIVDKYVKPSKTKIRTDKWKYYLIVYDLKKQGLRYPEISLILMDTYPNEKRLLDEKNIENYWKQAHFLIDESEYKKYLQVK